MKYFIVNTKAQSIFLILQFSLLICLAHKVENLKKTKYISSSEEVDSHDSLHPYVVDELDMLKGKKQFNLKNLQHKMQIAYNKELQIASEKIEKIISEGLSIFDDRKLLDKCIQFTINPPVVLFSYSLEKGLTPSFKEVANITMNRLQRKTMNILVEDDLKIEKLRHPKITIFTEKSSKKILKKEKQIKKSKMVNGPIALTDDYMLYSFLESTSSVQMEVSNLYKSKSGKMKKEGNKKKELKYIEENEYLKKAKEKFKLITIVTVKELQENLIQELIPFFVVSKKSTDKINEVVEKTVLGSKSRILQIDTTEINKKFPDLTIQNNSIFNNLQDSNKFIYQKIASLFSKSNIKSHLLKKDSHLRKKFINNIKANILSITLNPKQKQKDNNKREINDSIEKKFMEKLHYNYDRCNEISNKFAKYYVNIKPNCSRYLEQYNILKNNFKKFYYKYYDSSNSKYQNNSRSFKSKESKSTSSTIDKLINQMLVKSDISKKFLKLMRMEFQTSLYNAEKLKIRKILKDELYKKLIKFGPSTEEVKEHIK